MLNLKGGTKFRERVLLTCFARRGPPTDGTSTEERACSSTGSGRIGLTRGGGCRHKSRSRGSAA